MFYIARLHFLRCFGSLPFSASRKGASGSSVSLFEYNDDTLIAVGDPATVNSSTAGSVWLGWFASQSATPAASKTSSQTRSASRTASSTSSPGSSPSPVAVSLVAESSAIVDFTGYEQVTSFLMTPDASVVFIGLYNDSKRFIKVYTGCSIGADSCIQVCTTHEL